MTDSGSSPDSGSSAEKGQNPADEVRLKPEDQARVDGFLERGVNAVERKPFRPGLLIILLIVVVMGFSALSQGIAYWADIY